VFVPTAGDDQHAGERRSRRYGAANARKPRSCHGSAKCAAGGELGITSGESREDDPHHRRQDQPARASLGERPSTAIAILGRNAEGLEAQQRAIENAAHPSRF